MTTVQELLKQLQQRNIVLWLSGDKLCFRAPEGVFNDEVRKQVNERKEEIISILLEQSRIHHPEQWQEPFPLTEVQAAYLLGRTQAWDNGGIGCHGYAELELIAPKRWHIKDYQNAWQRMVSCHPMLKARIFSNATQKIDPTIEVPLAISLCHSIHTFNATCKEIGDRLRHRQYDPLIPPLLEAHIVLFEDKATLHISVDLIITDFIGINVILRDFFHALNRPEEPLVPPSLSFRDYVLHIERKRHTPEGKEERKRALMFWQEKAANFPQPMQLSEITGDTHGDIRYRRRSYILKPHKWQLLLSRARRQGITPTALALAALEGIARRYNNQTRTRITLTVSNRQMLTEDSMHIVGDFTSTLLLALEYHKEKSTLETAVEVQYQLFEALDYSAVSGIEVLRMLPVNIQEKSSRTPIVLTSTLGVESKKNPFYYNRLDKGLSQTPQVLLDIQLSDFQEGMAIVWDSKIGGYSETVLDAAFNDFCTHLIELAESSERWHRPILTPRPLSLSLPKVKEKKDKSIISSFCRLAQQQPNQLSLIDGKVEYNRGTLLYRASLWRNWLKSSGSQIGDIALIVLPPGIEQVSAQIGTLMARMTFVPIDPSWPLLRQQAIETTLKQSYPHRRLYWITDQTINQKSIYQEREGEKFFTPLESSDSSCSDELAYIIFTSGSTGTPKGVPITHRQVLTTLTALQDMLQITEEDRILAVSRPSFDLAIFNVFGLLQAGGTVVIPSAGTTPNPESWAEDIAYHQVTLWNSVPAQLQLLLDTIGVEKNIQHSPLISLRAALLSGDWIPVTQPATLRAWAPHCRFLALGGATEASIWSNYHEVLPGYHYKRSIPYGQALPGQAIKVINADGEETVKGQIGQIIIIGSALSSGYLGADNSAFIHLQENDLPAFLTGDLGRYLDNGEIEFLGRKDDQIKRHGYRIEPGEIVAVLQSHPHVADAAIAMSPFSQLLAVVTPTKIDTTASSLSNRAIEAIAQQHQASIAALDAERFTKLMQILELASLIGMHDIRVRQVPIAPKNRSLIARWDRQLKKKASLLTALAKSISLSTAQELIQQAKVLAEEIQYGGAQISYVEECLYQLESLVKGETDPLTLLFPEGKMDIARASYENNLINRYLNQLIVAGIEAHAHEAIQKNHPLRIIEIGAGVGGTTAPVIKRLRELKQEKGLKFEYWFTDISRFFLNEAKMRWPEVTPHFFDINASFTEQGIPLNSWDIVLCANVLHNARHIPKMLACLHRLLAQGGDLAIIDATQANTALMVTMEFKEGLSNFTDERSVNQEAFYSRKHWQQALASSPFHDSVMFPGDTATSDEKEKAIRLIHQTVIWARSRAGRAPLHREEINTLLKKHLPSWMVPDHLLILDQLPLTPNGKVDHQAIFQALPSYLSSPNPAKEKEGEIKPLDKAQKEVAKVWASVLGLDSPDKLSPSSNFFDVGGDSLLLAKCVGALRKTIPNANHIPWDKLLRQIVTNPTLEHCSRIVGQAVTVSTTPSETKKHTPILTLLEARSHQGTPQQGEALCLIHDGSGGLEPYHALIKALGNINKRPKVLGIQRTSEDNYLSLPAETLFDTLAERYIQALLAHKISRVWLFGYCMGGLIAAVMGEKLTAAGIEVKQLIVVSAYRIPFIIEDDILLDFSLARLLKCPTADIGLDFSENDLGSLITLARKTYGDHIPTGCLNQLIPQFPQLDRVMKHAPQTTQQRLEKLAKRSGFDLAALQAVRAIYIASLRAVGAFSHLGYVGDITFLRQKGNIHFLPTLKEDMTHLWQNYCLGKLTICDIEGNHFDCLEGEGARAVATLLSEAWA